MSQVVWHNFARGIAHSQTRGGTLGPVGSLPTQRSCTYRPKHAIFHTFTTGFSLRSSEPSQPRAGRPKGVAVEMCVPPLGSRRRPVANAAAPGADENGTTFPDTDHRKCSFLQGFIRILVLQPAARESSFCQGFCMVLGMPVRTRGKIHGNTMLWVI